MENSTRYNSYQKQKLIQFVTLHPNLASGVFNMQFTAKTATDLWRQLASEINDPLAAVKDWKGWRKVCSLFEATFK